MLRLVKTSFSFALLAISTACHAETYNYRLTEGRAYIWTGGSLRDLGAGPGHDIDGSGHVTAISGRAVLWCDNSSTDLGTHGGPASSGEAINGKDQITGFSQTLNNVVRHAFFWKHGPMTNLETLPGSPVSDAMPSPVRSSSTGGSASSAPGRQQLRSG